MPKPKRTRTAPAEDSTIAQPVPLPTFSPVPEGPVCCYSSNQQIHLGIEHVAKLQAVSNFLSIFEKSFLGHEDAAAAAAESLFSFGEIQKSLYKLRRGSYEPATLYYRILLKKCYKNYEFSFAGLSQDIADLLFDDDDDEDNSMESACKSEATTCEKVAQVFQTREFTEIPAWIHVEALYCIVQAIIETKSFRAVRVYVLTCHIFVYIAHGQNPQPSRRD